jgi:O-methyltransferase
MMPSNNVIDIAVPLPTQDPTVEQPTPRYARWRNALKRVLLSAGTRMPTTLVESLTRSLAIVEISNWVASHCSPCSTVTVEKVERVYDLIAERTGGKQTLYLEFGVWKGYSIRYWSRLLKHPQSILHGFDSFEGLPESWTAFYREGSFSEAGQIPEISDDRVKFFKGWFDVILPNYVPPPHDVLVVNIDCNIYPSAKYVLEFLRKMELPKPGGWIYLDEFGSGDHEFRAFREFVDETAMRFELVAQANYMWNVAFRRVA